MVKRGAAGPEALLRLLDSDPATAEQKYRDLSKRLVKFFQYRRCDSPQDLAQDTMLRVFERGASVTISADDPAAFFQGFANNLVHEARRTAERAARRLVPLDAERVAAGDQQVESPDDEASALAWPKRGGVDESRQVDTFEVWRERLRQLPEDVRKLLVEYYGSDRAARRRLAARMNLSEGALRTRVCRYKAMATDPQTET